MTSSRIERFRFDPASLAAWARTAPRSGNWPVVYTIEGVGRVYVGETNQPVTRMRQHLGRPDRRHLTSVRVVVDETFNKSVCLDLESFLIRMFAGDGKYVVDNANAGIIDADYYDRDRYRERFRTIFDELRAEGLFEHTANQIENSDLFKLSPYKALTREQTLVVLDVLDRLFADLEAGRGSTSVLRGQPGTGKTIVAIYLMKVLADIKRGAAQEELDPDAVLSGFFTPRQAELLQDFRFALVVPQQSLRKTVEKVFRNTAGLDRSMVLSPFDVGESAEPYDLLVVDEAHRLQQFSATMATLITKFRTINRRLFADETTPTQVDWVRRRSTHQIFLLDRGQTVRPADVPSVVLEDLEGETAREGRRHVLTSQMRVRAGEDYVGYIRAVLDTPPPEPRRFSDYDLRLFDDLGAMVQAVRAREAEVGLSRLVAGYAWKWRSKSDPSAFDIEVDDQQLRWNQTPTDWINSPTSVDEVGSIHTTQGYDLNYAGVIVGPDLRFEPTRQAYRVDRASYFDTKGKQNNKVLGIEYSDDDLLAYIRNIYSVLLTRGIRGTYVYVCDPALRAHLSRFIPAAEKFLTPADTPKRTPELFFSPLPTSPGLGSEADGRPLPLPDPS